MRALTNVMLFLVAILAIVGLYVFRQQSFASLQQFGVSNRAHVAQHKPAPPVPVAAKPAHARTSAPSTAQAIQVTVTVLPDEPKPSTDNIQIGMEKKKLWRW